eukprot:CAMPEP_0182451846 /NCGR_PEP_ID=MMETSP1172-20130603/43943_1 /TAXON_ID=708627 /ORGANISM="Timspurckia oligopyrenoides, Strain CCMP3278" /LENGTH=330 /DNA_ID=CAMNT_0024649653 /DNA_START=155 /DNA_END=1147 /DNA_ORIENTATION=+
MSSSSSSSVSAPQLQKLAKEVSSYITQECAYNEPQHLHALLLALHLNGETLIESPTKLDSIDHPFIIPLARDPTTNVADAAFLRWPTPPSSGEMPLPIVAVSTKSPSQLTLLANSSSEYVHRYLAYFDFNELHEEFDLLHAAAPDLYEKGAVVKNGMGLLGYLLLKVGAFPDVYQATTERHLKNEDEQSGLITVEKMASSFPGWGYSHAYNARLLLKLGRELEARDAARFAIHLPLWTLDDSLSEIAKIAGYQEVESLKKMFRGLSLDPRDSEVAQGKAVEQVALDRAAYVLDRVVAEDDDKRWSREVKEELAALYGIARLPEIAKFVSL